MSKLALARLATHSALRFDLQADVFFFSPFLQAPLSTLSTVRAAGDFYNASRSVPRLVANLLCLYNYIHINRDGVGASIKVLLYLVIKVTEQTGISSAYHLVA